MISAAAGGSLYFAMTMRMSTISEKDCRRDREVGSIKRLITFFNN